MVITRALQKMRIPYHQKIQKIASVVIKEVPEYITDEEVKDEPKDNKNQTNQSSEDNSSSGNENYSAGKNL